MTKQMQHLIGIPLLLFCVIGGVIGIIRQKKLKNSFTMGVARVYDYSIGGRGNAGGIWIDYILEVEGKSYKNSSLYSTNEIRTEDLKYFINRTFPVVYNPSNPSISSLMVLPKDFRNKGYVFPDTLRWILP
jgi:hypothetical protein